MAKARWTIRINVYPTAERHGAQGVFGTFTTIKAAIAKRDQWSGALAKRGLVQNEDFGIDVITLHPATAEARDMLI